MERVNREMTFEEESALYEKEACAEFAKEAGNGDCSTVNGILRRGMRIIRKARQEIARREGTRGRWLDPEFDDGGSLWRCSKCRRPVKTLGGYPNYNYCPKCGARMEDA